MTVHKTYTIGDKVYHARNNEYDQRDRHDYAITLQLDGGTEWIGRVRKFGRRHYWARRTTSVVPVADHCKTLKDAVTALALDWERRNPRPPAVKVQRSRPALKFTPP